MNRKIYYGIQPKLTDHDRHLFSRGNYDCRKLFQTSSGAPVAVSRNRKLDIWQVQYGFSSILFGTFEEALDFCRSRFYALDT